MRISVAIPSIPPRSKMLSRAVSSVITQNRAADELAVSVDRDRVGAAVNRDRAVAMCSGDFIAFLDDDDIFYKNHLKILEQAQIETGADLVYPWFDVDLGTDPFPKFEGRPWDNDKPHQIPITFLVRTAIVHEVGGFAEGFIDDDSYDEDGNRSGEDYRFVLKLVEAGAKIHHVNKRTWRWFHHASNTSGKADRW